MDMEKLSREQRADLKQMLLDDDDALLETKVYYKQMKSTVTNEDGILTVSGLERNAVYKVVKCYGIKDLSLLIEAGIVDAKDLV